MGFMGSLPEARFKELHFVVLCEPRLASNNARTVTVWNDFIPSFVASLPRFYTPYKKRLGAGCFFFFTLCKKGGEWSLETRLTYPGAEM